MDYYEILLAKKLNGGGGGGEATLIDKNISSNGTYNASSDNADGYKKVVVSVPNTYSAGDEGKVVSSGALVSQSSTTYTSNNTYDTTLINSVTVNVSGGGGGTVSKPFKNVNFYDYDGTIVYSYDSNEWSSMSDLPSNPTHQGLTGKGWNYTKAEIDAELLAQPNVPVNVGAEYQTEDGKTRFYCTFNDGRLSPSVFCGVNGTVEIDWGDGSQTDTLTGTNVNTYKNVSHTYASQCDYVISLNVTGSAKISDPIRKGTSNFNAYRAFKKVEFGKNIVTGDDCFRDNGNLECVAWSEENLDSGYRTFYGCVSLKYITMLRKYDSISSYFLVNAQSLKAVSIPPTKQTLNSFCIGTTWLTRLSLPSSVTTIGSSGLRGIGALSLLTIPASVTSIGSQAFYGNSSVGEYHFLGSTPPSIESSTFQDIPSDCVIYVPTASVDTYKSASNWSSYASYIQGE